MNTVSAVFFFAVLRPLIAGYGGPWFLPVIAGEAVNASLAFLCIAVGHWALRKLAKSDRDPAERVMHVATFAVLFAAFGKAWVEPQAGLSALLDIDAKLNPALILVGTITGLISERLTRRAGAGGRSAAIWGAAGWLMLGPIFAAEFDHMAADRRLLGAVVSTGAFGLLGLSVAVVGRLVGANVLTRLLAGVAVTIFVVAGMWPSSVGEHAREDADSILLVVVDTLRADMLEAPVGAATHAMPRLAEIARGGIRFTNAVAPSPWTLPSTATIVSGMNPYRHRVGTMAGEVPLRGKRDAFHLASTLRRAGYQSAYLVNNPYLRPYYGFADGTMLFRRYHRTARDGTAFAISWMTRHDYRPFFTLLHLMDPHWPYEAPARVGKEPDECETCDDLPLLQYSQTDEGTRDDVRRRYRGEVSFTDDEIGRLYDSLDEHGLLERTWIIVTADHGEELWDHGRFLHGHTLFDELVRVPLVVVPPRGSDLVGGRVVHMQVRLEDIAPTILEIAMGEGARESTRILSDGSASELPLDGLSLMGFFDDEPGGAAWRTPRPALLGFLQTDTALRYGFRGGGLKFLDQGPGVYRALYDLRSDPAETRNVLRDAGSAARLLMTTPAHFGLDPIGEPSRVDADHAVTDLDSDVAAELRSLGYLD